MTSSSGIFSLYGQSPRHTATLYADARNSIRQASISPASSRHSMQSQRSSSYDYQYVEAPQPQTGDQSTSTPPPPYSSRASVLPETLPSPSFASSSNANSQPPTSRAQKRRSSVMIKDLGMRILCAK